MDTAKILEQILELSTQMAETHVLPPLLTYAVDVAMDLFNAEHGYLAMLTPAGEIEFHVKRRRDGQDILEPELSYSILGQVLDSGEPQLIADAAGTPNLELSSSVRQLNLRSVMCVPLVTRDTVMGALYLDNRLEKNVFTPTDLKFLQLFANQAATSIDNALLYDDLETRIQQRTEELEITNKRLQIEIHERQKAQQQLLDMMVESERVKVLSSFIQDASHQFYTPISVINTSIYALKRSASDPQAHLSRIQTQVQTIAELVTSLVLMVKLESSIDNMRQEFDLNQAGNTTLMSMSAQAEANQQALCFEPSAHPLHVSGSEEQLCRAIQELLRNAIQYSGQSSRIALRVYANAEHGVLEITDNGPGIDPSDLEHIFKRFYRGDKDGTTRGFGLGLSIVQKIAENHDGTVEVENKPGQGCTFRLSVPIASRIEESR